MTVSTRHRSKLECLRALRKRYPKRQVGIDHRPAALSESEKAANRARRAELRAELANVKEAMRRDGNERQLAAELARAARFVVDTDAPANAIEALTKALLAFEAFDALRDLRDALSREDEELRRGQYVDRWRAWYADNAGPLPLAMIVACADDLTALYDQIINHK